MITAISPERKWRNKKLNHWRTCHKFFVYIKMAVRVVFVLIQGDGLRYTASVGTFRKGRNHTKPIVQGQQAMRHASPI